MVFVKKNTQNTRFQNRRANNCVTNKPPHNIYQYVQRSPQTDSRLHHRAQMLAPPDHARAEPSCHHLKWTWRGFDWIWMIFDHCNIVSRWAWPGLRSYIYHIDIYKSLLMKLSVITQDCVWNISCDSCTVLTKRHSASLKPSCFTFCPPVIFNSKLLPCETPTHLRLRQAFVWLGCKLHHHTWQRRKRDFSQPALVRWGERPEFDSSARNFLLIKKMNRNAVLIPGLMASYSTNRAVGFLLLDE